MGEGSDASVRPGVDELELVEAGVEPVLVQELLVGAGFTQLTVVEEEDAVRILDRGEAEAAEVFVSPNLLPLCVLCAHILPGGGRCGLWLESFLWNR